MADPGGDSDLRTFIHELMLRYERTMAGFERRMLNFERAVASFRPGRWPSSAEPTT